MELSQAQRTQLRRFAPDHLKAIERIEASARRQSAGKTRIAKAKPVVEDVESLVAELATFAERLTVGDIEDMEKVSGVPTFSMSMFGGTARSAGGFAALIWVLRRKDNPRYKYEDARQIPASVLLGAFARLGSSSDAGEDEGDDAGPLEQNASASA